MKNFDYDFDAAYAYLLENCDEYGITVTEGTGRFLKDGKPFDLVEAIHKAFTDGIYLESKTEQESQKIISGNVSYNCNAIILLAA